MKCLYCGEQMIQGGDHDCEDDEEHSIVSNFSCAKCASFALFYFPREEDDETC